MYQNQGCQETKAVQVPEQIARLNAVREQLSNSIMRLADRTKSVRREPQPMVKPCENKDSKCYVPLAEDLRSICAKLEQDIVAIDELTNSLEI